MSDKEQFEYKIASTDQEFDQIHRLNYETFVEEIPQHGKNDTGLRIDKFHNENTYLICKTKDKLIGMIAVRDKRPFSLDKKLDDVDSYLPEFSSVCELRLLIVRKEYRHGDIFLNLAVFTQDYCMGMGYDLALISGIVHLVPLYEQLGFVPFGPEVGTPGAMYQPMYLTLGSARRSSSKYMDKEVLKQRPLMLLPGPVDVNASAVKGMGSRPISHRGKEFEERFGQLRKKLCSLVNSAYVDIFLGTGTLANDVIGAQISLLGSRGLILSNGEFGNRLIDHSQRFGLEADIYDVGWGNEFDYDQIDKRLASGPGWLWCVHCETSSGILNDLARLKALCRKYDVLLNLDIISSIGNVPVDLSGVYLASGVSGKGLGSFTGLSFVFRNHELLETEKRLPRYLDIRLYDSNNGVPFSQSSNLVSALSSSLAAFDKEDIFRRKAELSKRITDRLKQLGSRIVNDGPSAMPGVITIELPGFLDSVSFGDALRSENIVLNYESDYLIERNLVQICPMGDHKDNELEKMLQVLTKNLGKG